MQYRSVRAYASAAQADRIREAMSNIAEGLGLEVDSEPDTDRVHALLFAACGIRRAIEQVEPDYVDPPGCPECGAEMEDAMCWDCL